MNESQEIKFVILCVLDGWGIAPPGPGNAISQAKLPNFNKLRLSFPHTQLEASGESVGLPTGEVGNTETGHLNLGAGKIVYQDLARINMSIADGTFFDNQVLLGAIEHAKKNNSNLHIMGLVSGGVVHSSIEHLFAIIEMCKRQNFDRIFIHAFTDGRDSAPNVAKSYLAKINEVCQKSGRGKIASIMGRYWAMDRDQRLERTQKAYDALTKGIGHLVKTSEEAIDLSYNDGKTDEFIEPSLISENNSPLTRISENDAVIFFNFRIDRPRQLTSAFMSDNSFKNLYFVTMTEYTKPSLPKVAFPPELVSIPLGRVIADHNLRQLRVSESEKEKFVTSYFNGQQEITYVGEDRLITPSPKVPTYDLKPEMSAREITESLIQRLSDHNDYSFILVNYANADMVGHTGNLEATIKACEVLDECIGKLANFVLAYGGALVITADHGNAEEMLKRDGSIDTEHSNFPVPFMVITKRFEGKGVSLPSGILADVAPTIISLLRFEAPTAMLGRNLLRGITL